jgi:hypothetical protein
MPIELRVVYYYRIMYMLKGDRYYSVGITTRYGSECPEIEFLCGEIFQAIQTGNVAHPASCRLGTGSFLGIKLPELGADHPPPPSVGLRMDWIYASTSPLSAQACHGVKFVQIKSGRIKLVVRPCIHNGRLHDSIVGIVTTLWTRRPRNGGSIPSRENRFLSFWKRPDLLLCPTNLLFNGHWELFRRGKAVGAWN